MEEVKKEEKLFNSLNKTKLREEIVEQLKSGIIAREILPGEKLPPERKLAEMLNVNRSTLREALNKLESMELVEIKHGAGIYVKDYLESGSLELARAVLFRDGKIDFGVSMDLLLLRKLLVPEMAYYAALNRKDEHLDELEKVIFQNDELSVEEKDIRLHHIIAKASGNVLFVILLNSFQAMTMDYFHLYFDDEKNRKKSATFHKKVYKAIKKKDADSSRDIMRKILIYAEKQVVATLGKLNAS